MTYDFLGLDEKVVLFGQRYITGRYTELKELVEKLDLPTSSTFNSAEDYCLIYSHIRTLVNKVGHQYKIIEDWHPVYTQYHPYQL